MRVKFALIHVGLLLKESTLDSIGHDLWKKYDAIFFVMDDIKFGIFSFVY